MNPGATLTPLLNTLEAIQRKYGKHYCYPSQATLADHLDTYHDIHISNRTINRWLRFAEDAGYIRRTRRIKYDPRVGTVFKSTLYILTKKAYALLSRVIRRLTHNYKRDFSHTPQKKAEASTPSNLRRMEWSDPAFQDFLSGARSLFRTIS
jgi:hypothetical protein